MTFQILTKKSKGDNMIVLNECQEKITNLGINHILHSSDQVFEFSGEAGTGKSVVLYEIVRRLGLEPHEVLAMAPTGQAAIIMRTKGFRNASSIHSSLFEFVEVIDTDSNGKPKIDPYYNTIKTTRQFVPKSSLPYCIKLMIIDEGYMVPDYLRPIILKFGIKVVVAGDRGQLPPVKANPAFLYDENVLELNQLMRQSENSPIVYLARRARKGLPIHCGLYGDNVLVIEENDLDDEMVRKSDIVLCGTNKTRDTINNHIRHDILGIRNKLPVHGDRLICRKNNWNIEIDGISLANGLVGSVTSSPNVGCFDGKIFNIDFKPDLLNCSFRNVACDYKYFIADPKDRERIKNDKYSKGNKFEYAYCSTTHLSQGSEYRGGIYIEENLGVMQNNLNYTGITRFKKFLIYVKKNKKRYYFI